ncbi:NAD(P)/FAD-dependent oxidoreductase [Arvimicrobium flavum]|uniref:NAD(P)/FAD-dependent oxidoreductase n=1 Tax=Arvimicrobium flavum TaxID=3393320 RepID=UPI00237B791D|nr:FAD-dependent oxidoreductase [Mesorhizobium shangrilense]
MKPGVVIIGAGHGGSQAAVSLRQEGYAGAITLIGAEHGYPYHRPPLSKAFLKDGDGRLQPLRGDGVYESSSIDYRPGARVRRIDLEMRNCVLDDGEIAFDELILATGAVSRTPDIEGIGLAGVFALRTAVDARGIKQHMAQAESVVIVGGGFIGLETAATMAASGKRVTVLEIGERLLARAVSPVVSAHVLSRLTQGGVEVRFGTQARAFAGDEAVRAVLTVTGETIAADMVIVGIGADPDVALAVEAGLAVDAGIVADDLLRCSASGVYAIGDCVRFPHWQLGQPVRLESVQNATDQARHVAGVIMGKSDPYRAVPWFWSDTADMKLQMVGLSANADRHLVAGDPAGGAFAVYHFRRDRLVAIDTINRPADHMLGRKMIAAGYTPDEADIHAGRVSDAFRTWASEAGADGSRRVA